MKKFLIPISILIIVAGILIYYFVFFKQKNTATPSTSPSVSMTPSALAISPSATQNESKLAEPIAEFKSRITKKPFGIYITPQNSPVQPERFTGYHTGVDAEYGDVTTDAPVYAIVDGIITYSKWTSGYGGCFILKVDINGVPHSVLYGHIRPTTLPSVGQQFKKGEQIAVLGTAYSTETDGERRHLHLGILSDDRIDVKGYVSSKSQLSGWIDPLSLY